MVRGLVDAVFSWSITDVMNKNYYSGKMKPIPETFSSTDHYLKSFIYPLLEETRACLSSKMTALFLAPIREITEVKRSKDFEKPKKLQYLISLKPTRENEKKGAIYEPDCGDLIVLTDERPRDIVDLKSSRGEYIVVIVQDTVDIVQDTVDIVQDTVDIVQEQEEDLIRIPILSSKAIEFEKEDKKMGKKGDKLFAVYLINLTTNMRIWEALNSDPGAANMNILRSILNLDPSVGRACTLCSSEKAEGAPKLNPGEAIHDLGLNKSQEKAILNCIATKGCHHQNTMQLIWGPPGTGKTKTVASLLFVLLHMKCRTLTCAPTNVAAFGVINRLMALVRPTLECDTYGLGDIILFGNQRRMKIDDSEELFDVFLDNRVSAIAKCLDSTSGFKRNIVSMILLLEDPEGQYQLNLNKTRAAPQKRRHKKEEKEMTNSKKSKRKQSNVEENVLTFEDFIIKNFISVEDQLSSCMKSLYTHMPTSVIEMEVAKNMIKVVDMLQALRTLFQNSVASNGGLRDVLFGSDCRERRECVLKLELIQRKTFLSLPILVKDDQIRSFCLNKASLIFCTASSSSMLHTEITERRAPVELVIIDEAAQLKECEAAVPLQLLGLRHAILVGDEKQLPAMVQSKEAEKAGFGRSSFERLVKLGQQKHLLNEQYRMLPSISSFPNTEFYRNQIMDGPNVRDASYKKHYLEGCMYGSYSFIDIGNGIEQFNKHSWKNLVEVSVVAEIISNLCKRLSIPEMTAMFLLEKTLKIYNTEIDL